MEIPRQFYLADQETPMTMQVGMVGSDGIVLASDTLWTQNPVVAGRGARHGYNSHKIRVFEKHEIAISSARDMETANFVGDSIVAKLKDEECPADREFLIQDMQMNV